MEAAGGSSSAAKDRDLRNE